MNFDLTLDQQALRDGVRSLCDGRFPMKRVRAGFDRAVWDELAAAGVFSMRTDFGVADAAIVFEELGRALVPGPLVWSHLGHRVARGVVGGIELDAAPDGPPLVEHLDHLDTLLVVDDDGVHAVEAASIQDAEAVAWPLDPLTPLHRVLSLPQGERVVEADGARQWRLAGAVLTAAYLVGQAMACTELSVAYAQERRQFDRPIGSFQAVKHLLADMAVRVEMARVAVHAGACTLDDPEVGDVERAVAAAKALAGEAGVTNGRAAMQVHGGMGFTAEVDVHLYLKRAWTLDTVFGSAAEHADTVAARLAPNHPQD